MDFMKHKAAVEVRFLRRMSLAPPLGLRPQRQLYGLSMGDASVSQVRDHEPYFLLDGRLSWKRRLPARGYVSDTTIPHCDLADRLPGVRSRVA